ncbi:MAG: hypothetical protein ACOH1J_05185, partial [Microbacteriaceae bacterium]
LLVGADALDLRLDVCHVFYLLVGLNGYGQPRKRIFLMTLWILGRESRCTPSEVAARKPVDNITSSGAIPAISAGVSRQCLRVRNGTRGDLRVGVVLKTHH